MSVKLRRKCFDHISYGVATERCSQSLGISQMATVHLAEDSELFIVAGRTSLIWHDGLVFMWKCSGVCRGLAGIALLYVLQAAVQQQLLCPSSTAVTKDLRIELVGVI